MKNPYSVKGDGTRFHVCGPRGWEGLTHKGTGAQTAANKQADDMNRAYNAGFYDGCNYTEQLETEVEEVQL